MIDRLVENLLINRLKDCPAVALLGPRQCGKTTLAKTLSENYFDLEQEEERTRLDVLWNELTKPGRTSLVVLDEAQSFPPIFPRLRGAIDNGSRILGRFLLLGSISPSLMKHVSESLAGRLSIVHLSPFILPELKNKTRKMDKLWFYGGFPDGGIRKASRYPRWQNDYLSLLSQRDLPNWGISAKPLLTDRLFSMLAALNGQILNASSLSASLGITHPTVASYLDYLEGAFLIRRLPPFFANLKKRIVKSPKIYWKDSGLLHALMNVSNLDSLLRQPWVGASWEAFVIEQIISVLEAKGLFFKPYFFRTHDNYECDLILDFGNRLYAIEIKLTSSPSPQDLDRLKKIADMLKADKCFLISRSKRRVVSGNIVLCDIEDFIDKFADK
jgi:predicted AAA+ superfamily ATPase